MVILDLIQLIAVIVLLAIQIKIRFALKEMEALDPKT